MALVVNDRVKETTTTTGTGTVTLGGAVSGFDTFAAGIGNSNTTYYCIQLGAEFEVGLGTLAGDSSTLARTTVISSSNSDNAVNFSAGAKNVFCTLPASKATVLDASGNLTLAGAIDVDGITNLDVVDIDGAVDMASTLQVDGAITSSAGATITTADNTTQLTLKSTDADGNTGPELDYYRLSSSPADNDYLGRTKYIGRNDNSQDVTAVDMFARMIDVSDGTEDATFNIRLIRDGSLIDRISINVSETILNEGSGAVNFRVESDGQASAFLVDGANDLASFAVPVTAGAKLDMNGTELILDADADTSITADTDDRIDFRIGGADKMEMNATAFSGGAIYENADDIAANYSITAGKNALSVGPITIASGVTVTVPSGQRWVIL